MQFKLPWILSRKRLITAAVSDGTLFAFLYYSLFNFRFGVWPSPSPRLAVLLAIWTLISYVIGRYSDWVESTQNRDAWTLVCRQLIYTGFILFFTLAITLLHIWLFDQNPVQASFRSFLIPFLGSLAILSPVLQLMLRRFFALQEA